VDSSAHATCIRGHRPQAMGNMKVDRNEGYWGKKKKKKRFLHFYENFSFLYIATHGREKLEKLEQWEGVLCDA